MESVLVVDDEPAVRRFTSRVLSEEGYGVKEAVDGVDALRLIRTEMMDLDAVVSRHRHAEDERRGAAPVAVAGTAPAAGDPDVRLRQRPSEPPGHRESVRRSRQAVPRPSVLLAEVRRCIQLEASGPGPAWGGREGSMTPRFLFLATLAATPPSPAPPPVRAARRASRAARPGGFPVSCAPEAQRRFEHAMAVLHSLLVGGRRARVRRGARGRLHLRHGALGPRAQRLGQPLRRRSDRRRRSRRAPRRPTQAAALPARDRRASGGSSPRRPRSTAIAERTPNAARLQAYADTMARLHRDFPRTSRSPSTTRSRWWRRRPAPTRPSPSRSGRSRCWIRCTQRYPDHPGLAHYIIHSTDSPGWPRSASRGPPLRPDRARRAPRAAHAVAHLRAARAVG